MLHFVYPYIIPKDERFGWELKYSIRSLFKFCPTDFDITIVGERPDWLKDHPKLTFIELHNSDPIKYPRVQFRSNQKLLKAAELYKSVVLIHDDMYFIREVTEEQIKIPWYVADDMHYNNSAAETANLTMFQKQLRNTSNILKELGKPYTRNYAAHTPMYFESAKLFELNDVFPLVREYQEKSSIVEVAYYNYFGTNVSAHADQYRLGYWYDNEFGNREIAKVLNHDESGYLKNPWIKTYLDDLFPDKSPLEK